MTDHDYAKAAYSIDEFSKRSSTGRTKLYEEIRAGRLKAVKCGKRTLIRKEDGDDWLANLPLVGDQAA